MHRAVVVVLDGLRRDLISEARTPNLVKHSARARSGIQHRSVFPSATRVVSASFATGCLPARHELQGNSMALVEDGRLVPHDAGHPDFLQRKRRITGRSLAVPTLAERVKTDGGAIIFSNVSPGAAYAHDPDGHGFVYHRAGSFGPGRKRIDGAAALNVSLDAAGDRAMAQRFIDEVLFERRPALALMWLCDPDSTQHARPLGSPDHLTALRAADEIAGLVMAAAGRLRDAGDDVLLIICSDHGHQTVSRVVDVEGELISAGLKDAAGSAEVMAQSNGTATLVYVDDRHSQRIADIGGFLASRDWAERVVPAAELGDIGQSAANSLAFAVSLTSDDEPNAYGVRGRSIEALPAPGKAHHLGCGQHGGLARYEQSPFLMIEGGGFAAGGTFDIPTSVIDLAPTILTHLRLPAEGMDGRSLQA